MTLEQIWKNPLMWTDLYNESHHYLKIDKEWETSHIYNRTQPMLLYGFNETVRTVLDRRIFEDEIVEAEEFCHKVGMRPFPTDMFFDIVKDFKGRIPLEVRALPDGTWVPKGCPFSFIRNTEPGFGELVTYWEAMFLHAAFASGCATRAAWMKDYLRVHNCNPWRFHSFGFRGHNSMENAYWAGTAWNLFLVGTDDFHTKLHTPNAPITSIPATAHKTVQQFDNELEAYLFSINQAYINGHKIVAIVIDTYDANRFIEKYLVRCIKEAQLRGMDIVFRPDSGKTLEQAMSIYRICSNFGYKNVSVIIGEGMSFDKAKEYDEELFKCKVPLNFVSYGIGAGFYKDIDRDFTGWAMKTARSNGKDRMKFSMDSIKQSIPGEVSLQSMKGGHMLVTLPTKEGDLYKTIYHMSERTQRPETWVQTWDDIYERCKTVEPNIGTSIVLDVPIQEKIAQIRKENGL